MTTLLRLKDGLIGTALIAVLFALPTAALANGAEGRIAFDTDRDGNYEIYAMNPDGSDPVRLTGNFYSDTDPSYSPDGSRVVFTSTRPPSTGGGNQIDLYRTDTSGKNVNEKELTNDGFQDLQGSYSPDGTKIVYLKYKGANNEIHVINSDTGAEISTLVSDAAADAHPVFSADGNYIFYARYITATNSDIYRINADGSGGATQLTSSLSDDGYPALSRDGSKIVFRISIAGSENLWTMSTDGSNRTAITSSGDVNAAGSFSPDGSKLTFAQINGASDIYTMQATAGSALTPISPATSNEFDPNWSPVLSESSSSSPGSGSDGSGSGSSTNSLTIQLTSPQLAAGKTKKMKRSKFAKYIKNGFKFKMTNSSDVKTFGASLFYVRNSKKATRCYRFDRPTKRVGCSVTRSEGLDLKLCTDKKCVEGTFKPLLKSPYVNKKKTKYNSRGRALISKMTHNKVLRKGIYVIKTKAHLKSGGSQVFEFTFKLT